MAATSVKSTLENLLRQAFDPDYLKIDNESSQHNVAPGSETHFKVIIVSEAFVPLRAVARHQAVYRAVAEPLSGPVHALALHTYTPEEWAQSDGAPASPECLGGSRR